MTLGALARHHDISRNPIRLCVEKYDVGEFDDDDVQADLPPHCQRGVAELERKVGQLVMENEWLRNRRAVRRSSVAPRAVARVSARAETRLRTHEPGWRRVARVARRLPVQRPGGPRAANRTRGTAGLRSSGGALPGRSALES